MSRGRSFGSRGLLSSYLWCSVRMWQSIMGNSPLTCCCSSCHHSRSPPFLSFSPYDCSSDSEVTPPPACGVGVVLALAGLGRPLWDIFLLFVSLLLFFSSKHLVDDPDVCASASPSTVPVTSHDVLFLNEAFGSTCR